MQANPMKRIILIVAIALLWLEPALAASFATWPEQIVTDATGHYYGVAKVKGGSGVVGPTGGITLTIVEQQKGTPKVNEALAQHTPNNGGRPLMEFLFTIDPKIQIRDRDVTHGQIELNSAPGIILVSSEGKGIVTLAPIPRL